MMRRSPMKRVSELRRTGWIKPKRQPAGTSSGIRPEQRMAVLIREQARCLRCRAWLGDQPSEVHHRKPRSRMGDDRLSNLVHICSPCHRDIHTGDTIQATQDGWLVTATADPAGVAVLSWDGWVALDDEGGKAVALPRPDMQRRRP